MAKYVKNKTTRSIVNVEKMEKLCVAPGPTYTGSQGFAVIAYPSLPMMGKPIGWKLAEFSKEDEALKCLDSVVDYVLTGASNNPLYLEIDDKVEASLLVMPDSATGGSVVKG